MPVPVFVPVFCPRFSGKRRRQVNLQKKTLFIPELGKKITLTVSTKALKTMKKRGAFITLQKAGLV